jgi:MFS family permease
MKPQQTTAVIAGSALVTLDGASITVALPAIGRELDVSLQWVANMPLLAMAAMLLPAGAVVDRCGRIRVLRAGLLIFAAASLACSAAAGPAQLIALRFVQGAGAALLLPAALAVLRAGSSDAAERARVLGVWAAWTGAAAALGPLLAGLLVDLWSWRGVFMLSATGGFLAALLLASERQVVDARRRPLPVRATVSLIALLGSIAYLLIERDAPGSGRMAWALGALVPAAAATLFLRDRGRKVLLPYEVTASRNCLAANGVTFALYFGMFGLSFVVSLYVQQVLERSALMAAAVLLPLPVMLFLAERFGRLAVSVGARALTIAGTLAAASGPAWLAASPHPIPIWVLAGAAACFGLGLSLATSPLTHAAVAGAPESCAGAASALNHASVRAAGLLAVALLGSIASAGPAKIVSPGGVALAMLICAAIVAAGGMAGSVLLRNEEPGGLEKAA